MAVVNSNSLAVKFILYRYEPTYVYSPIIVS